jgi:hypothetical protein
MHPDLYYLELFKRGMTRVRLAPADLFIEVYPTPRTDSFTIIAAKDLDRQRQKDLLGHEPLHFDHFAVKEFIQEFIRFELLFFVSGHPLVCDQVDVHRLIERKRKGPKAAMTANLQRTCDFPGNSYMVRVPVQVQDDVDGAEKLEVERVVGWKKLPQPVFIPVEPESAT